MGTASRGTTKLGSEKILTDVDWVMGRAVSSAKVPGKVPDTPASLNHVLFNKPVNIWVEEELVVADGGATLGEILSKINAVYDKAFEGESDGESKDKSEDGYGMIRFFGGFWRVGVKDYCVSWGNCQV
ncbi:hypothetical protein V496_01836 [Pseudogymnoascus sp. VKM F-4515 (FW-2607)]|nr:hypothetical protein V496_01836 [Pseudogymnoascus sp. VKM F-4515 (FW-2607)]KFY98809.1 hypothetical protein V498_01210 [Pseudogymnoascus sp. VKM F-4517 (FW-2822)]